MKDDLDYNDDIYDNEDVRGHTPQESDPDTFRQRNDPKELIERYKLNLMNAYIVYEQQKDKDTEEMVSIKKIKIKKNTKPKANKQGVADIIGYLEKFINSHVVQGNIYNMDEFRNKMRSISSDVIIHFIAHRVEWGMTIDDIDEIIGTTINLIDLFLTRTLFNKEREGYGESYRETVNRDIRPAAKPGLITRTGDAIARLIR